MTRSSVSRLAAIAAIAGLPLVAFCPSGLAQSSAQTSTSASSSSTNNQQAASPELSKQMSAKVEEHIQELRSELQITPSEETAWKQFADVMRSNAAQMEKAFSARSTNLETMTAMQNMQSYADLAQVHATNMQKLASSFQALYNSFPASQKQVADEVFREHHEKMKAKNSSG